MNNLSRKLDTRLFTVKFGNNKNIQHSGIEAKSIDEARAIAEADSKDTAVEVTSEPIYKSSISIESDTIFEISIKGIDQKKVDRFTELLAKFIGGPAVDMAYPTDVSSTYNARIRRLNDFIMENEMLVAAL